MSFGLVAYCKARQPKVAALYPTPFLSFPLGGGNDS